MYCPVKKREALLLLLFILLHFFSPSPPLFFQWDACLPTTMYLREEKKGERKKFAHTLKIFFRSLHHLYNHKVRTNKSVWT